MKTKLLLLTLPLLALAQSVEPDLKWVDEEIAAIKPPREGLSTSAVRGLNDPFSAQLILNQPPSEEGAKVVPVAEPEEQRILTLRAIFNGRRAYIDGKWYEQEDDIYGYIIKKIERDSVLLEKKQKKLKLSLITKNDNIKINAK